MESPEKVIVVGAGIMGLTSAMRLREAGHEVEVWSKDPPERTVSTLASFWEPFATAPDPQKRDRQWGKDTFDVLHRQVRKGVPGLAVFPGLTIFPEERNRPDWAEYVPSYRDLRTSDELRTVAVPHGVVIPSHAKSGYSVEYPTFDMPPYLKWLRANLEERGVRIFTGRKIDDFSEPLAQANIVVNCTGLGTRDLTIDRALTAMRGQLVKVTRPKEVDILFIDDEGPRGMTHVMLHENHVMLGGTAEYDFDENPDPEISRQILERCIAIVPALAKGQKIEDVVGLRPYRKTGIRLEPEDTGIVSSRDEDSNRILVHNYGHGGSGVTFSWGCANEVTKIVRSYLKNII